MEGSLIKEIKHIVSTKESVDTLYLFFLQGANYLIPLITTPYLMKVLGASGYGLIGFSFAVIMYFDLVVGFGFNMSATKRIASIPENKDVIFTSIFVAKTLLIIISLLFLPVLFCIDKIAVYRSSILCYIPLLIGSAYTHYWLFQGLGKVRIISVINTVSKIIVLPLTFVFVSDPKDVYIAILIQSIVFVVACVISNIYIFKNKLVRFRKIKFGDVMTEVADSYPLFLSSAATSLYTQLFTVILGFTCSPQIVGCYSACERIIRTINLTFFTPLSQAYFPKFSKLAVDNFSNGLTLFKKVRNIVWLFEFLLIIFIWLTAGYIAEFIGKDYDNMHFYLRIMSLALFAISFGALYGQMGLIAMGNNETKKSFSKVYIYAAPLSLLLMFFMTHFWGINGTILTLLITEYSVCISMFLLFSNYIAKIRS